MKEKTDTYKHSDWLADVPQEESDVAKHKDVAEQHSVHICLALSGQLILNRALGGEREISEIRTKVVTKHYY